MMCQQFSMSNHISSTPCHPEVWLQSSPCQCRSNLLKAQFHRSPEYRHFQDEIIWQWNLWSVRLKICGDSYSNCLEGFVHCPLGLVTCISVDLLEHFVQSSFALLTRIFFTISFSSVSYHLLLFRLGRKGFVNFGPIASASIRSLHTACACSWNSPWRIQTPFNSYNSKQHGGKKSRHFSTE